MVFCFKKGGFGMILLILINIGLLSCLSTDSKSNSQTFKKDASSKGNTRSVKSNELKNTTSMTKEQLAMANELIEKHRNVAIDGKEIYKNYCGLCHGIKGDLNFNGAKDLTKSTVSFENAVAQVYYGAGLMTPFREVLKEEEIVGVAKFIKTLRN